VPADELVAEYAEGLIPGLPGIAAWQEMTVKAGARSAESGKSCQRLTNSQRMNFAGSFISED
jgi:hypothetical protein